MDEIAGAEDPFLWEKHKGVSVGMASAKKEDLHLAVAATEDEAFFKAHRGQDVSNVLQLVEIGFFEGNIAFELLLFRWVGGVGELAPASFNTLDVPAETLRPRQVLL